MIHVYHEIWLINLIWKFSFT